MEQRNHKIGDINIPPVGEEFVFTLGTHQGYQSLGVYSSIEEGVRRILNGSFYLRDQDRTSLEEFLDQLPPIAEAQKQEVEEFAVSMLSARTEVSVPARKLRKLGYNIENLHELISRYNRLPEEERTFRFERDYGSPYDLLDFNISITRK